MSHNTNTGSGGTMLSQSRDERRRLEREGVIQQQHHHQQHHHHHQAAQNQHMYEYGGTGHQQGEMRGDAAGATSPSVFDSIYEELDAGLHAVDAGMPSDPGGVGRANYRTSSGGIGGGGVAATGNPAAAASARAGSNDPRKSYMRGGGGGSGGQPSAAYHHQHQQQHMYQHQPQRTVHPSEAQAALAKVARDRQMQMQQHQMQMQMQKQQQMMLAQSESERYEPIALSHSVLQQQQQQQRQAQPRGVRGMGSSVRGRGNGRGGGGGNGGPDIDSLVVYGNDRDDMSENSGLSQQRLLKKRHGHRLGSSSARNYPKRNPNKKSNVTILGMPDPFGGGGKGQRNHPSSSANAVPKTTENAYERRLARERMRGLVRVGSSRVSNRGGGVGGGAGMGGYDGVESVDGESTSYAAPIPARQQQQQQQQTRQIPAQRDFADGQRGQQQTPWWEGVDTTDLPKSEEQPQQQQQQRRVPRSDGSTDGHDGRGGYDFGSLPLSRTAASTGDSYEGMGDHAGSSATGAFPSPQTVTRGYDNGYPPAGATAFANSGPMIVPKRRSDRPFLAHSSSAGKIMEPIVEEEGATPPRGRDSWEQQDASLAFHQQQQPSPLNRSGENLFNQYSINPVPNDPHRRNVGEGGGPSPRLGAPPAPTSYYDSPGPNDAAVGSPPSSYNDDPNIVVGQWESPEDDRWNDSRKDFSQDKYEAAAAAAAAAIAGENAFSPTSVAGEPSFSSTNRQLNYDEANQDFSSDVRAATPNSVLTDEMSNPIPRTMIRQRFSPDAEVLQRPPRSSPVSLSSGQITAVDSAAAVAPAPDPMSQSQEETDRAKRIEKAHAIRQRRVKEAREHGEDLLRSSPQRSAESSYDGGSGPLSPIDEIGMPRGELTFQEDTEWEPDEKLPSKRDIQKGRASEDLKGRVIDLSPSSSKREKPETPRITFQDAEFGFIEAVAAVVIQTFIRRYLAYKTATIRYEAALTVKDFIINATHARREAREQEEELEFAQRQAEVEAQKREKILAKAHEQARMLSEADAAAIAEAESECLQEQGGDLEQQHEERAVPRYSSRANLSEDELAAIKIQAAFRGWWVRDCLSVDNYCATLIQQAVRGYLRRMQYEFDFYRIVIVQSAVRRFLAKRKVMLAKEGAEYVEVSLATEEEQMPRAAPRPASQKSWSVPAPSSTTATKGVPPRPEAKTQSFAKTAPVIIETGGGKGSLINAWKAREAQAKQQAAKPNIVYQSKSKVLESSTVEERRMVTNVANNANASATEVVETTKVHKSSEFTKTVQRVHPATNHQQQIKSAYSPEQNAAATKIQAQWRCFAAEMDYVHKLDCILLVQSLARRWVTMKLVLPYMIMARNGDFGEYNEGESYEDDAEFEEKKEVADTAPSAGSVNNNSAMSIWKGREANATTMEPMIRTDTVKINTGASGGGSNSVLQKWKQKEAEAIEKAKRPGGR